MGRYLRVVQKRELLKLTKAQSLISCYSCCLGCLLRVRSYTRSGSYCRKKNSVRIKVLEQHFKGSLLSKESLFGRSAGPTVSNIFRRPGRDHKIPLVNTVNCKGGIS